MIGGGRLIGDLLVTFSPASINRMPSRTSARMPCLRSEAGRPVDEQGVGFDDMAVGAEYERHDPPPETMRNTGTLPLTAWENWVSRRNRRQGRRSAFRTTAAISRTPPAWGNSISAGTAMAVSPPAAIARRYGYSCKSGAGRHRSRRVLARCIGGQKRPGRPAIGAARGAVRQDQAFLRGRIPERLHPGIGGNFERADFGRNAELAHRQFLKISRRCTGSAPGRR
jgi:hypothetical protein